MPIAGVAHRQCDRLATESIAGRTHRQAGRPGRSVPARVKSPPGACEGALSCVSRASCPRFEGATPSTRGAPRGVSTNTGPIAPNEANLRRAGEPVMTPRGVLFVVRASPPDVHFLPPQSLGLRPPPPQFGFVLLRCTAHTFRPNPFCEKHLSSDSFPSKLASFCTIAPRRRVSGLTFEV
jgi:hypothetical protein